MSVKDIAGYNDHHGHDPKKTFRRVIIFLASFSLLIIVTIFFTWLILRPSKPKFYIENASIHYFNLSSGVSSFLSLALQISLSSRNPNSRIEVYYDRLDVYAVYKSQQITLPSVIPPTYSRHQDVVVWSPFLYGVNVPISSYVSKSMSQDESSGVMMLYVKVDGRLRWKVGSWISGHYHIFVSCPAVMGSSGGAYPAAVLFRQNSACIVDV